MAQASEAAASEEEEEEEVEAEAEAEALASSLWVVQAFVPLASADALLVHHLVVKESPWVQALLAPPSLLPSFQLMAHRQPRALPAPGLQLPCLLL